MSLSRWACSALFGLLDCSYFQGQFRAATKDYRVGYERFEKVFKLAEKSTSE